MTFISTSHEFSYSYKIPLNKSTMTISLSNSVKSTEIRAFRFWLTCVLDAVACSCRRTSILAFSSTVTSCLSRTWLSNFL